MRGLSECGLDSGRVRLEHEPGGGADVYSQLVECEDGAECRVEPPYREEGGTEA